MPIPPPNASAPEGEVPPPSVPDGSADAPDLPDAPEAPEGDPVGFAQEYLARVAAGDSAGVDEAMCAADQEWQYEDAVSEGLALGVSNPQQDSSSPDKIVADLNSPEGELAGRISMLPDAGGWCVETFYVF